MVVIRWIELHPDYKKRSQRKGEGKDIPLLSAMFNNHDSNEIARDRIFSTDALSDFSDSDDFMDSPTANASQPETGRLMGGDDTRREWDDQETVYKLN